MRISVFPLDFQNNGGLITPVDQKLHQMAQEFCIANLAERVNLKNLSKVWVAAEVDDDERPVRIIGVAGYVQRVDIALFRVVDKRATVKLHDRMQHFFADNGLRGSEVLIYVSSSEPEEARCPEQKESLEALGAKKADRYAVTIR